MRAAAIVVVLVLMSGCACLEPGPVVYHYGGSGQFRDLGGDLRRPVSVPEPGALGLMGLGIAGLFIARRKRK